MANNKCGNAVMTKIFIADKSKNLTSTLHHWGVYDIIAIDMTVRLILPKCSVYFFLQVCVYVWVSFPQKFEGASVPYGCSWELEGLMENRSSIQLTSLSHIQMDYQLSYENVTDPSKILGIHFVPLSVMIQSTPRR